MLIEFLLGAREYLRLMVIDYRPRAGRAFVDR
jgi:hypothetical protein